MRPGRFPFHALAAAALALATVLHAGEQAPAGVADPAPVASPWWFRVAPYVWVTSTQGNVGLGRIGADVDVSMGDTLSTLQGALMFVAEAGYGDWSIENDVILARLEASADTPLPLFGQVKSTLGQVIWTSYLGRRLFEAGPFSMDLQAGFRLINLSEEIELTPGLLRGRSRSLSRTWIDPVIGLRTRTQLTRWLFLPVRGDVGGFGANSEFTWQAFAGLGAQLTRWGALLAGYRALGYNYDQAGFEYNVVTHGPVIGFEAKF